MVLKLHNEIVNQTLFDVVKSVINDTLWDFLGGLDLRNEWDISAKESLVKSHDKFPEIFDGPFDSKILRAICILPIFRESSKVHHELLHIVFVKCCSSLFKDFLKNIWILG